MDGGWGLLDIPGELGGTVIPPSLRWAIAELVLGSNPAVHMYSAGMAFAKVLFYAGTEDQKKLAAHITDKQWGATMVLTEPDAGSDVGAGRTRAVQQPDGTWHLTGVKRFITSGEHDLSDNIVHFVLARPEGAGPGTKGLSLFIVPKFHVDLRPASSASATASTSPTSSTRWAQGLDDLRADASVRRSPASAPCSATSHDGIAQMFRIIEYARMMVGTKAIATLSTGYLNALGLRQERDRAPT